MHAGDVSATTHAAEPALLAGYVDKSTVAAQLGVSERTIDRLCDQADGPPYIKIGHKRLFSVDSFRSWLAGREAQRNRRRRAR